MMDLMINRTYIIHLYRYEEDEPDSLVGIVEDVEEGTKDKFGSMDELWQRLKPAKSRKRDVKKKRRVS